MKVSVYLKKSDSSTSNICFRVREKNVDIKVVSPLAVYDKYWDSDTLSYKRTAAVPATEQKRLPRQIAAIIEHEGRILATQRGYGDFKDGWEFPGGKMEPGETPEAAIVREIEEELKVTIAPKTLVTTVECDYPKFHLTMHCFLSSIVKGEICLVEHEAAKWLSPDELDSVDWLPADVEVVEKLKTLL